jgi:hypothetical protein
MCHAYELDPTERAKFEARFWKYVDKNGPVHPVLGTACWDWTGGRDPDGYGITTIQRRSRRVPRVACELADGPVPDGLQVLHRCDRPCCLRRDHLFLGTHAENHADKAAKGRGPSGDRSGSRKHPERLARGERVGLAKLTAEQVTAIRLAAGAGVSVRILIERYGVSEFAIRSVIACKTWAHVA